MLGLQLAQALPSLPTLHGQPTTHQPPNRPTVPSPLSPAPQEIKAAMREQFRPEDLEQFAIAGDADFDGAVGGGGALRPGGLVTVKGDKKRAADGGGGKKDGGRKERQQQQQGGGRKQKGGGGGEGRQQKKKQRQ